MSEGKRAYRVVGGDLDGEVYDDVSDSEVDSLLRATEGERLEPVDSPRVPDQPVPEHKKPARFDVDVGEPSVEPEFVGYEPPSTPSFLNYAPPEAPAPRPRRARLGHLEDYTPGQQPYDPFPKPPTQGGYRYELATPAEKPDHKYAYSPLTPHPFDDPDATAPDPLESALDATLGFENAATLGGGDEFIGMFDENARDMLRNESAAARERAPLIYHGAEAVGGLPAAMLGGVPTQLAIGAIQGGLSSDAPDAEGRWRGARNGAMMAGALHGGAAGLEKTAAAARTTIPQLQTMANEARNAALASPDDFQALAQKRGLDFAFEGPNQAVKDLGLANKWWPQSARSYANKAKAFKAEAGPAISANLEEAGLDPSTHVLRDSPSSLGADMDVPPPESLPAPPLPPGPGKSDFTMFRDPVSDLEQQTTGPYDWDPTSPYGRAPLDYEMTGIGGEPMEEFADRLPTAPLDQDPTKILLGGSGRGSTRSAEGAAPVELSDELLGPQPGLLPSPGLNVDRELTEVPGQARGKQPSVDDTLRQLQLAAPDGTDIGKGVAGAYGRLRENLPQRPLVMSPAELNELKTAYHNQAFEAGKPGKAADLPTSASEKAGAGAGRATNDLLREALARNKDPRFLETYDAQMGPYSAASLIEDMATHKAAGTQGQSKVWSPMRSWGSDAKANLAERAQGGVQRFADTLDQSGKLASALTAPLEQWAGRPGEEPAPQQPYRGIGERALSALAKDPSVLGPYAARIQEAANNPAPGAIDDLMIRLVQTDPQFRAQVLTRL